MHSFDYNSLNRMELVEEINKFKSLYQTQLSQCESYEQEIYTLKRNNGALNVTQRELSDELDSIHKLYADKIQVLTSKHNNVIAQHQKELLNGMGAFEDKVNSLVLERNELKEQLFIMSKVSEASECTDINNTSDLESKYQEKILDLINAHDLEIKQAKLDCLELQREKIIAEDKNRNILSEIQCLRENLNCKKTEAEQLKEQQQELYEEIATLRMEMNNSDTAKHEEKGNSLFAEVNDRRLKLEYIVRQYQSKFLEMKRQHAASTNENRLTRSQVVRLENKLTELVKDIGAENEELKKMYSNIIDEQQKKIQDLEKRVLNNERENLKKRSDTSIVDIMERSRKEQEKMKTALNDACYEKRKLQETIRNLQQDLNRWKAESLKYSAENVKLKLKITEQKTEKNYESFDEIGSNVEQESAPKENLIDSNSLSSSNIVSKSETDPKVTSFKVFVDTKAFAQSSINENNDKFAQKENLSCIKKEFPLCESSSKSSSNSTNERGNICQAETDPKATSFKIFVDDTNTLTHLSTNEDGDKLLPKENYCSKKEFPLHESVSSNSISNSTVEQDDTVRKLENASQVTSFEIFVDDTKTFTYLSKTENSSVDKVNKCESVKENIENIPQISRDVVVLETKPKPSILTSNTNIFLKVDKPEDDGNKKNKVVTFTSDTVSPVSVGKCVKKTQNWHTVPVNFVKSNKSKMIIVEKKS